jgi:hypothetical protein
LKIILKIRLPNKNRQSQSEINQAMPGQINYFRDLAVVRASDDAE